MNGTFSDDQEVSIYAPKEWKAEGFNALDAAAVGNVGLGVSVLCAQKSCLCFFLFAFLFSVVFLFVLFQYEVG